MLALPVNERSSRQHLSWFSYPTCLKPQPEGCSCPQFSDSPCTLETALWLSFDRQPSLRSPPSSVGKKDGRKKSWNIKNPVSMRLPRRRK